MTEILRTEHPRPDRMRAEWLCLNGCWDFEIDNDLSGVEKEFYKRRSLSSKINVPFCPESALSGVWHTDFMAGVWYRRDIEVPGEWGGKRILLHIDACDYEATVYVNGTAVGSHKGGYTPFCFDITDYLSDSGNYVSVFAKDDVRSGKQVAGKQSTKRESYGCFYTRTTGIWQTVWLEAVEAHHIISYKVDTDISTATATVRVLMSEAADGAILTVSALFEDRPMAEASATVVGNEATLTLPLKEAHLWECGNGRLYDLKFSLEKNGRTDRMNGYFGLREVSLTKECGLKINGKTVFGRFVLDQGFYPDGIYTAPSDEALIYDIKAAMACGFNGARLHQKVFEPRFLYHADRLGYMVWGELGNWGLDHTDYKNIHNILPEWCEEVERDYSHPSIIGWCPTNETWDIDGRPQSNRLLDQIYDKTKEMDKTRPTITSSGSYPTERTDVHDVHDYEQDPEKFRAYYADIASGVVRDQLWRQDQNRQKFNTALPVFVSEYGGIAWVMKKDEDAWGYGVSVKSEDEFFTRLKGLTDALLDNPHIFAFCYTQLTDVEQEQNGLLTYERKFKFPPEKYAAIFSRKAAIEHR